MLIRLFLAAAAITAIMAFANACAQPETTEPTQVLGNENFEQVETTATPATAPAPTKSKADLSASTDYVSSCPPPTESNAEFAREYAAVVYNTMARIDPKAIENQGWESEAHMAQYYTEALNEGKYRQCGLRKIMKDYYEKQ